MGKEIGKDLKVSLRYVLLFFCLILYWEVLLYVVSHGTLSDIRGWFLLFALAQALIPAALCGWGKDRLDRVITTLLALLIFAFYCAHLIYCRVFGSMITMSMVGMGGDALYGFGGAMMSTVQESLGWLFLFAAPVLALIVWIFLKGPSAVKVRHVLRPILLVAGILVWLAATMALRLGGEGSTSAYYAYTSSYVDTDTAAGRLGVMTTSLLEVKSLFFQGDEAETASMLDVSEPELEVEPVPVAEPETIPGQTDLGQTDLGQTTPTQSEGDASAEELPKRHENPAIDFAALAKTSDNAAITNLCNYFSTISGTNENEYTGLLEGYNLIYICAESFCSYVISPEATPTLYRMANEGIVLTNYYNSFKNTTTNGEYTLLTSLWPDVSRKADKGEITGSFGQSMGKFMPYGPGNIFRNLGVTSYAYHNYYGSYYGRDKTHPNLGYKCKFRGEMKFTTLWPASDLQMMKQSVDDYINQDRFNVYYMTFSGHGPYNVTRNDICHKNLKNVPEKVNGRKNLTIHAKCYIACNLEVEKSMAYLLQRLEEAGKLDNTLIVLTGDHYPYYLTDEAAKSILGTLPEKNFERYHSTCIMWCGGLEKPIVCDTPCCNVDILPTILNLMGIDYDSRMISGVDIFSDSLHAAMLYNKSFITDKVKYNAETGKITVTDETWHPEESELKAYVDNITRVLNARYAAALSVNKNDFYRFVWTNSGLMEAYTAAQTTETTTEQPAEESPEDIEAPPEDLDELPEDLDELPEDLDELPEDFEELPEDFDELPEDFDELPEDADEPPEDADEEPAA